MSEITLSQFISTLDLGSKNKADLQGSANIFNHLGEDLYSRHLDELGSIADCLTEICEIAIKLKAYDYYLLVRKCLDKSDDYDPDVTEMARKFREVKNTN